METVNRILYIPGKNPKPPPEQHRAQLLRALVRGVERVDPAVARALTQDAGLFSLIAWNSLYYQSSKPLDEDLPWIEALLKRGGPTEDDVREALSFRRRLAWLLYTLGDIFHVFIPLLPDPAVKNTIQETARYFSNRQGSGETVRQQLKVPLRRMWAEGRRILIIAHSMGSVIAYDALWELTHMENNPGKVDLFLTIGSPLGMRFTQERLLCAHEQGRRRYPHNIRHWVNLAAQGDLTALDPTLRDDFKSMPDLGLVESLTDVDSGVFNYFRNEKGLNVHRSYGYLVNPRMGEVIAAWWKGGMERAA